MFDITDVPFSQVTDEEKQKYAGKIKETGSFQGYKLRQYWHLENGVRDQLEHYNINRDVMLRSHPEVLRSFLPEVEAFAKHNHFNVLYPILRLLARGLELPEDTFVEMHGFASKGETYVRFMKYYPRSQEEEEKTQNVWLKGHTDFGTITILYSQPVAALQMQTRDGQWKWVKHIPNALIINAGDALEFLSGGYYRATIHRVIQPPPDQRNHERLILAYFAMTDDDIKLTPLVQSPVLQRIGINRRFSDEEAPTMETWRKGRTSVAGQAQLKSAKAEKNVQEEYINGVRVKYYI
ncbi:hypothetical protein AMATHDRAFT_59632 [Amanita thiersii Skay4041]|uniref:Fe2OG dioxygenase domain-containing protein n=1 Tax=Amanita thiersii Skay4041 TaxID=703135 RepID=A0A2A9NS46_9AGAR|nr:hypothetical protein AMATHDRAFT_59632 [Amanita thiersii Skay4041]